MTAHGMRVLVLGAGGHGRVVAELAQACGADVRGFVEADPQRIGDVVGGVPVVAEEGLLFESLAAEELPAGAVALVLGVGDNAARAGKLTLLPDRLLPRLVHPTSALSPSARIGPGTVVLANTVVHTSAFLGRGVIVNSGAIIEHDCRLEDAVHVSPGAVLAGAVEVGARSWIGAGATVIQGITIGRDVIVGAGAAVVRDVSDGVTVVGVPARPIDDAP